MKKFECNIKTNVKSVEGGFFLGFVRAFHNRLGRLQIDIGKLFLPEVKEASGHFTQLEFLEVLVCRGNQVCEACQDPLVRER